MIVGLDTVAQRWCAHPERMAMGSNMPICDRDNSSTKSTMLDRVVQVDGIYRYGDRQQ